MKRLFILIISLFMFIPSVFAGERINVAINIDNKYTTYALLTINSILKNNKSNSDYTFYVLHDGLSWWNKWRMRRFVHKNKQDIEFIKVDLLKLLGIDNVFKGKIPHISRIAIARIFLPNFLPNDIKKIIYIDCDTLVNCDLKELFNIDITKYAVAMREDLFILKNEEFMYPECIPYYNSGVILINIDYWKNNNIVERLISYLSYNDFKYPDQDALNVVLKEKILPLGNYWNNLCSIYNDKVFNKSTKGIIHYVSLIKPWNVVGSLYGIEYDNVNEYIDLYVNFWQKSDLKYSLLYDMYINFQKYVLFYSKLKIEALRDLLHEYNIERINRRNENYNKHPKVSVVVPVYNGAWYLPRQSKSLLNQTFKNFEIVYVNDGSTDNTLEMLRELQRKYKNIRVISQENQGPGGARNSGLSAARGDYVIFLDVDDTYNKNMLKLMYNKAIRTDSDIVVCRGYWVWYGKMFPEGVKNVLPKKEVFNYRDLPDMIFSFTHCCVWNKLYKRKFLVDNGMKFRNLKHGEDLAFVNKSLIIAESISVLPNKLVTYHMNNIDSASTKVNNAPEDSIKAWFLIKEFLDEQNIYDKVEKSYLNAFNGSFLWTYDRLDDKNKKILIKKYKPIFKKMGVFDKELTYYYNIYDYIKLKKLMGMYPPELLEAK